MKKIIEKIFSKDIKKFYKTYPVTMISIFLLTLYAVINNFDGYYVIPITLLFFSIWEFLLETFFESKKIVLAHIFIFFISILVGNIVDTSSSDRLIIFFIAVNLIIYLITLYKIILPKKKISEYLCKLFENEFIIGTNSIIIIIGLFMIIGIIDTLIFSIDFDIYERILYIVFLLYTVPNMLNGLLTEDYELSKFIDILISKILIPLFDIAFAIILIYIVKIILELEVPQNEVFAICSSLFIFMVPITIFSGKYKSKYYEYNSKYLAPLFIIPLILQIYSLAIRINDYGITLNRYLGIALLVIEIGTIVFLTYKNKKYISNIFILIAVTLIVTNVLPYTNMMDVVTRSQIKVIKEEIKEDTNIEKLENGQKRKVYSAYRAIVDSFNENEVKYLFPDYLKKIDFEELYTPIYYDNDNRYLYLSHHGKEIIDISEYKTMKELTVQSNKNKAYIDKKVSYDFSEYINEMYKEKDNILDEEYSKYVEKKPLIKIDDNTYYYIKDMNLDLIIKNNEPQLDEIYIDGYLLTK